MSRTLLFFLSCCLILVLGCHPGTDEPTDKSAAPMGEPSSEPGHDVQRHDHGTVTLGELSTEGLPVAEFNWTNTGLTVDFMDATIEASGDIVSWLWNLGDDNISTMQNPSHTYAISATYVVTLTVTDDEGDMDSVTHFVAAGEGPAAAFTYTTNGHEVMFTDASSDPDGAIVGWRWNFGDGTTSLAQNPTHTYAVMGTYNVTLEVFDEGALMSNTSMPVVVLDPPVADFNVIVDGLAATFTDISVDSSGTLTAWDWDLGDGNVTSQQNHTYIYQAGGVYSVTLTVTSSNGATASVTKEVTVNEEPRANFDYMADGLYVDFTDTSIDMDGTLIAWTWELGDGNGATEQNPRHVYVFGGTYSVMLTVEDDRGDTASVSKEVTISPLATDAGVLDGGGGDGGGGDCGCDVGRAPSRGTPSWPALSVLLGIAWLFVRRRATYRC